MRKIENIETQFVICTFGKSKLLDSLKQSLILENSHFNIT